MNKKMTEFFTKYVNEKYNFDFKPTSIAQDLIKKLDYVNSFQETYKNKKSNSPNWTSALEFWISEIETRIDKSKVEGLGKYYFSFLRGQDLFFFQAMPETDMDFTDLHCEYIISNLFDAYSYAQFLESLKSELEHLKSTNNTISSKVLFDTDFNTDSVRIQSNESSDKNFKTDVTKQYKIKWLKNSNLIAYLISELKNNHFIEEERIWDICENVFIDKNERKIKATTFTSTVGNYSNNNGLKNRNKPKEHKGIDTIINALKDLEKD